LKECQTLSTRAGRLWVVATPIGNIEDLSPRARRVLSEVDTVVAEDTRHSGRLLRRIGVSAKLVSLHEHNEQARVPGLLERMREGQDLALVSDAGTPLLSDPGFRLVRAARQDGLEVLPVPGPSAAIAALSVAGLPSDRFWFEGFLPATEKARRLRLDVLLGLPVTVICFESAHRIGVAARDLAALSPGREVALAREVTKQFEQHFLGTADGLVDWIGADVNRSRGEFVLLIGPHRADVESERKGDEPLTLEQESLLAALVEELPLGQAARVAARVTGVQRNRMYARALEIKS